jgi:hypothetical protein
VTENVMRRERAGEKPRDSHFSQPRGQWSFHSNQTCPVLKNRTL